LRAWSFPEAWCLKVEACFSANSRSLLSGSACVLGDRAVDQFHQIRVAGDCILTRNGRKRGHHSSVSSLRYSALQCFPLSDCSKTFTVRSAAWPWGFSGSQQSSLHLCLWWHCRGPFSSDTLELLVSQMDSFKELRAPCSGSATQRVFNQPLDRRFPMWLMLGLAGVALV